MSSPSVIVKLRTPEIIDFIENMYMYNGSPLGKQPIIILGPPGIGKSEAVVQAAERIARKLNRKFIKYDDDKYDEIMQHPDEYFVFVDLRLTEVEPSDLMGIPREKNGTMFYIPPSWAKVLSKAPGILFLDELTQVQRDDIFAAAHKILLDKMAGFTRFHPDVMVVAAGNTPEDSPIARPLPTSLINRTLVIRADRPSIDEWAKYMEEKYGDKWDKRVYAFLMYQSDKFIEPINTNELERLDNFATPRTYTMAAVRLAELANAPITQEMLKATLVGLLGPSVGQALFGFITTSIDVESIINNPDKFGKLDIDKKFFVVWATGGLYNRAVSIGDDELRTKIEEFVEKAIIKKKPEHWLELLTLFVISLSGEPTKMGVSPRHKYLKSLSTKYPKVIDELYKVAVLAKSIRAQ
jgi:hypothetical protein